jgi:hypothetical protein
LEALQQEVDTLNNERRDLKEKLKSNTKRNLIENLIKPDMINDKNVNKNSSPSSATISSDFGEQEVYNLSFSSKKRPNANNTKIYIFSSPQK